MTFFLYIDESGDPGRYLDANRNPIPGSSKWFTLGGIIVGEEAKYNMSMDVTRLALSFFPQSTMDTTKLHYQQLIQKAPPYDSLSDSDRLHLTDGMFDIIRNSPCRLLSSAINLVRHFDKYDEPEDPKAYALVLMLERFQGFLASKDSQGIVIYESINRTERKRLKGTMKGLKRMLAPNHYVELKNIPGGIRSGDPLEEPVLQLADFFAYATHIKYRSNWAKQDRWKSVKEKYYNPNGGYYSSGIVSR